MDLRYVRLQCYLAKPSNEMKKVTMFGNLVNTNLIKNKELCKAMETYAKSVSEQLLNCCVKFRKQI